MSSYKNNEKIAYEVSTSDYCLNGPSSSSNKEVGVTNVFTPLAKSQTMGFLSALHPSTLFSPEPDVGEEGDDVKESDGFGLHVQVRTRDGGWRSPLVMQQPLPQRRSFSNSVGQQNSETTSPFTPSFVVSGQQEQQPQAFSATPSSNDLLRDPLPSNVVHRSLYGKCRFVQFPQLLPYNLPPPPPAGGSFPLFVGQVRFETTPAELIWLFRRTSGATASTAESRGNGCFILHLKSETERGLVRQLHKRILFDVGGVWFARSSEEVDSLCEYVALYGPYLSKQAKLPRDSMVVEDIKTDSVDAGSCYQLFHQGSSPYYFSGDNGQWSRPRSRISTPTTATYNSKPTSPLTAPLSPAHYTHGRAQND